MSTTLTGRLREPATSVVVVQPLGFVTVVFVGSAPVAGSNAVVVVLFSASVTLVARP
ncbi:hypothetical protein [Embleya sp. AB8]|uniref:hypothetical protein n=1 Tax=Embleya sp. AB8 TaxID=3156304 RepID=UPI003C74E932